MYSTGFPNSWKPEGSLEILIKLSPYHLTSSLFVRKSKPPEVRMELSISCPTTIPQVSYPTSTWSFQTNDYRMLLYSVITDPEIWAMRTPSTLQLTLSAGFNGDVPVFKNMHIFPCVYRLLVSLSAF